jgi:hypothetical protein
MHKQTIIRSRATQVAATLLVYAWVLKAVEYQNAINAFNASLLGGSGCCGGDQSPSRNITASLLGGSGMSAPPTVINMPLPEKLNN